MLSYNNLIKLILNKRGLKPTRYIFLKANQIYFVSLSIFEVIILIVHYKSNLKLYKTDVKKLESTKKHLLKFLIYDYNGDELGEGHLGNTSPFL